jgi:hypothetical protein
MHCVNYYTGVRRWVDQGHPLGGAGAAAAATGAATAVSEPGGPDTSSARCACCAERASPASAGGVSRIAYDARVAREGWSTQPS